MVLLTPNLIFHLIDLIVGVTLFIGACVGFQGSFDRIFLPMYLIVFAIAIITIIFWLPPIIATMIPFYFNFLGRGLAFLFLALVVYYLSTACGIIIVIVAFLYAFLWIVLLFTKYPCSLPPPLISGGNKQANADTTTTTTTVVTQNDNENPDYNNNGNIGNNGNNETQMTSTEPR